MSAHPRPFFHVYGRIATPSVRPTTRRSSASTQTLQNISRNSHYKGRESNSGRGVARRPRGTDATWSSTTALTTQVHVLYVLVELNICSDTTVEVNIQPENKTHCCFGGLHQTNAIFTEVEVGLIPHAGSLHRAFAVV